ncbi:MAG: carbohydrate ABC transporter permease [Lachnospiraceae bacterium]|jgi:multiple sugar transport system permease protein
MGKGGKVLLIVLGILFLLPVLWTVFCSFLPERTIEEAFGGLMNGEGVGAVLSGKNFQGFSLEQYRAVLIGSPDYLFRFWRSVLLVVPIVFFQLVFAIPAAYGFSRTRKTFMQVLFFVYILLFMVPAQVTVIPSYLLAKQVHLDDTDWSVWLPGIFSSFSVYLLSRRMFRIPGEVLDAARVDGAGEMRILRSIAVPMCWAEIASCAILLFMDYWNMVEYPVIMFSSPLNYPLSVYLSRIQEGAVGISFAASVIYLIPPVLVFLFGEEYLTQSFQE